METDHEPSLYRHLEHNANAKGHQSPPMASAAARIDPPAPCVPVNPAGRVALPASFPAGRANRASALPGIPSILPISDRLVGAKLTLFKFQLLAGAAAGTAAKLAAEVSRRRLQ